MTKSVVVKSTVGLHASLAAKVVQAASKYNVDINLIYISILCSSSAYFRNKIYPLILYFIDSDYLDCRARSRPICSWQHLTVRKLQTLQPPQAKTHDAHTIPPYINHPLWRSLSYPKLSLQEQWHSLVCLV